MLLLQPLLPPACELGVLAGEIVCRVPRPANTTRARARAKRSGRVMAMTTRRLQLRVVQKRLHIDRGCHRLLLLFAPLREAAPAPPRPSLQHFFFFFHLPLRKQAGLADGLWVQA
jgi:hypothetical protein